MWQELKEAHFICSVRICSSLQQALDERDGATEAACQEQRGCSTESTGVDISPSLVNISRIASVISNSAQVQFTPEFYETPAFLCAWPIMTR
jgi:hypothetical protein